MKNMFNISNISVYAPLASMLGIVAFALFSFRVFIVTGESMVPTYVHDEYVFAESISYRFVDITRGDVIVFENPHNKEHITMKRVIGLPNEEVSVKDTAITIKDQSGNEQIFKSDSLIGGGTTARNGSQFEIVLGPEDYFVLGDNRSKSTDSREWGAVQMVDIIGKVMI